MKKRVFALFLSFLTVFALIGCGAKTDPSPSPDKTAWPEMEDNTNSKLKYFGFYHFDDEISKAAAMGSSNIGKADADDLETIETLYENGYFIFVMIRHVFFNGSALAADWEEAWTQAKTELAPYMDKVIGFYMDEPMWNGREKSAFHTACQTVLNDYPDRKMMGVLAYAEFFLSDVADYYKYCTDLGYDYYENWNYSSVSSKVFKLEEDIAVYGQNIWLVPKAFYVQSSDSDYYFYYGMEPAGLLPGDDLISWIKGSYQMAVADSRIVGIFAYSWGTPNGVLTLRDFFNEESEYYRSDLKNVYVQVGKAVINNA